MTMPDKRPALPLMAHLVAGYPDEAGCLAAAAALAAAGAAYLEIQFPFSDPSADGPTIELACAASLAGGFRMADGFALVRRLVDSLQLPVFIMSYANPVCARGVADFCRTAADAGAAGLIVPDLCPGHDEGLYAAGRRNNLAVVPVIAPGIGKDRLAAIQALRSPYLYVALRTGITGDATELDSENLALLAAAGSTGTKLLAGFGICRHEQLAVLDGRVHAAVVGSFFCRIIGRAAAEGKPVAAAIKAAMAGLGYGHES